MKHGFLFRKIHKTLKWDFDLTGKGCCLKYIQKYKYYTNKQLK